MKNKTKDEEERLALIKELVSFLREVKVLDK